MESYQGAVISPNDALILLEAARQKLIPKITRRLKEHEREQIKPGSIYIFNEKEAKMRRWTDGRSWSASRVTGAFLTYREMEVSNTQSSSDLTDFKYKQDGLIKQSFSLTTLQNDKLHLISYTTTRDFTNSKFMNKTPSNDPLLKDIKIPKNIYPQHAFLDNPSSKSPSPKPQQAVVTAATTTSPISSPIYHSLNSTSPTPIPDNYQNISLPPSSIPSKPTSLSKPRDYNQQQPFDQNQVKLPPLNLQNIQKIDYDEKALNALDKFF